MSSAMEVGNKLVELCRKGNFRGCLDSLYSPTIVSVEAQPMPNAPSRVEGIAAVKGKTDWWEKNHEVHSVTVNGPWPHGDRFIVNFSLDITPKAGPMAGKRFKMDEAALYTVKDGKIVNEEFFYTGG